MDVNTGEIRNFLFERFDSEELDAFCFDYFAHVHQNFTRGMTKREQIQLLLDYCRRYDKFSDLLAALERERPSPFKAHFANAAQPPPRRPQERNPDQIFISYAHQDTRFAHLLASDLQKQGWQVWIAPESIQPGEKWVEAIGRGLQMLLAELDGRSATPPPPPRPKQSKRPPKQRQPKPPKAASTTLSLWNPLDYGRLGWWLLTDPQSLTHYMNSLDENGRQQLLYQNRWLSSTCLWWPIIVIIISAWAASQMSLDTAVIFLILLLTTWALTAQHGHRQNIHGILIVFVGIGTFIVSGGLAASLAINILWLIVATFLILALMLVGSAIAFVLVGQTAIMIADGAISGAAGGMMSIAIVTLLAGGGGEVGIVVFLLVLIFTTIWLPMWPFNLWISILGGLITGMIFYGITGRAFGANLTIVSQSIGLGAAIGGLMIVLAYQANRKFTAVISHRLQKAIQ